MPVSSYIRVPIQHPPAGQRGVSLSLVYQHSDKGTEYSSPGLAGVQSSNEQLLLGFLLAYLHCLPLPLHHSTGDDHTAPAAPVQHDQTEETSSPLLSYGWVYALEIHQPTPG